MTIKGPYLVEAKGGAGASLLGFTDFTEAEMLEIYQSHPTRQKFSQDDETTDGEGKRYEIVWFTDQGYSGDEEDPGPHSAWDVRMETTVYAKADQDAPAAEVFTSSTTYTVIGTGQLASGPMYYQQFKDIGKYMWRLVLGCDKDTKYPTCIYNQASTGSDDNSERGSWAYSTRTMDFARMHLTITPQAAPEFTAVYDLELEALPTFIASAAQYINIHALEIQVATNFARTDDRWTLLSDSYITEGQKKILRNAEPWGAIDGITTVSATPEFGLPYTYIIHVDTGYFSHLLAGRTCVFVMRFNHVWNASNQNYVESKENAVRVLSDGKCKAPEIEAEADRYRVNIITRGSNGSDDNPDEEDPDIVLIAMADAKFKNEIQTVDYKGSNTANVQFAYPPLDVEAEFEAVGLVLDTGGKWVNANNPGLEWHASEVATCSIVIPSGDPPARVLTSSDGVIELKLIYYTAGSDRGPSVSTTNDGKTEQLSGRTFPSVFYGGSATRNISFSGTLLDDTGEQFDDAVLSGLFIVRYPNGRRFAANLNITTNPTTTKMTSVSVSGQEVDF